MILVKDDLSEPKEWDGVTLAKQKLRIDWQLTDEDHIEHTESGNFVVHFANPRMINGVGVGVMMIMQWEAGEHHEMAK